jgi:hypothetical protein
MAQAINLTDKERAEFVEAFYEVCHVDDRNSELPWGCPWLYDEYYTFTGGHIHQMARNYYEDQKRFIIQDQE